MRVAMSQTWRRLTFLHWPYEPALVQPLLSSGLVLDTFDGAAWIGLLPFEIYNLRGIPHFSETNVRTYVIGPDGSRAVWFFSLDAARLAAVLGARVAYHCLTFGRRCVWLRKTGRFTIGAGASGRASHSADNRWSTMRRKST